MSHVTTVPVGDLHRRAEELLATGTIGEAIDAHQRLLAAAPDFAEGWFNLGYLQRRAGRHEEALAAYQRALDSGIADREEVHLNRGVIFANNLAMSDEAEGEFRAALAINPSFAKAEQNLGGIFEDRGDRENARAAYERVLALEPSNAQALSRLAVLGDVKSADEPLIMRVRAAIAASPSPAERADLGFALGRALDGAGAYDEAFAAYATANRDNRDTLPGPGAHYDRAVNEAHIDGLIRAFATPARRIDKTADRERPPIFICGMFRSGSTLAERILGAHSDVTAAGELPLIPALVRNGPQPYPEAVAVAPAETIAELRAAYLEGLRTVVPEGLATDKRPDNFLHIGLIKRLFPDARIIDTRRQPIDNCLSVWFLHLNPAMSYAHELETIAHWHGQYRRLMAHWRTLYGDDIHEVDYDALVVDPRLEIERLLEFCGLPWEEGVLAFHQTANPVRTASAWQVREPLYTRSSGRSRNYAGHLEGLRAALGEA